MPAAPLEATGSVQSWRALTAQVGREIAEPLNAALERVIALNTTGRIDRDGLRALRTEIEQARRIGMVSQQLSRLASKHLRQSHERLNLAHTLQSVLAYRAREVAKRGVNVRQVTRPIEVLVDPSLLFTLLNAVLDWAVESGRASIDFRVDLKSWPTQGRVSCSFQHHAPAAEQPGVPAASALDSLNWHLIVQAADSMELGLHRDIDGQQVMLTLEFPRTVDGAVEDVAVHPDEAAADAPSINSKPLAGRQLLVIADGRELRSQVRAAVADMGLTVDCVYSVDEAIDFCRDRLPHAIVFEAALRGEELDQLAQDIRAELPGFSFIEIVEEGRSFEISGFNGMNHARVGRAGLRQALPSALVFELSKAF
jgi:CheY-like chemotaxis protein